MEDYYKQFTFDDKARMLSVVVHDNLDGDLFLSVTLASWYLRQMDTYLSKN